MLKTNNKGLKIIIRTEADKNIGYGHAVRCSVLAKQLYRHGCDVYFLMSGDTKWLEKNVIGKVKSIPIQNNSPLRFNSEEISWISKNVPTSDWFIIDSYHHDYNYESQARVIAKKIAVIDGLLRPHNCDLWIDPIMRKKSDHRSFTSYPIKILQGKDYLIIDDSFLKWGLWRDSNKNNNDIKRILLNFSGGISYDANIVILDALKCIGFRGDVMLIGSDSEILKYSNKYYPFNLICKKWVNNMAEIAAHCDASIGGLGMAAWERCVLGLPSINFVIADNQYEFFRMLQMENVTIVIDTSPQEYGIENCIKLITDFIEDSDNRVKMSKSSRRMCDGYGSNRIVNALLKETNN